jgi:hypothetical protein
VGSACHGSHDLLEVVCHQSAVVGPGPLPGHRRHRAVRPGRLRQAPGVAPCHGRPTAAPAMRIRTRTVAESMAPASGAASIAAPGPYRAGVAAAGKLCGRGSGPRRPDRHHDRPHGPVSAVTGAPARDDNVLLPPAARMDRCGSGPPPLPRLPSSRASGGGLGLAGSGWVRTWAHGYVRAYVRTGKPPASPRSPPRSATRSGRGAKSADGPGHPAHRAQNRRLQQLLRITHLTGPRDSGRERRARARVTRIRGEASPAPPCRSHVRARPACHRSVRRKADS